MLHQNQQLFKNLQERKETSSAITEDDDNEKSFSQNEEKSILSEYANLYEENSDLYGWIEIKDSVINYPVMYTPEDPNFYLYKNWFKEYSPSGSIFIDGRADDETENLIIYGHNMYDGTTMFSSLVQYKQKEHYESHKYIQFETLYETSLYEIIAVSKAVVYNEAMPKDEYLFYEHMELNSEDEFNKYIEYVKENSYYEIENTATYGDKLITLCTCDYGGKDARLLIVAKGIK